MISIWLVSCLHLLHSCSHLLPEWVSLFQWSLHPRPLVLWRRSWLLWRLWWTPLLQWVLLNSLTPRTSLPALCRSPTPQPFISCSLIVWRCLLANLCSVRDSCEWCSGECESVVYSFVDDVVSQASYCGLHSSVVTPLNVLRQTAPPPLFIHPGLQSLTLAFV